MSEYREKKHNIQSDNEKFKIQSFFILLVRGYFKHIEPLRLYLIW